MAKFRHPVLFLLGINLALRAGDEHYDLRWSSKDKPSQINFEHDAVSGKRYLVYREDLVTKINDGGLNNLKKERKVVWIFLSNNTVRYPVRLVDKYMSLCPEVGKSKKANFYLRSLENRYPVQWYGDQPVGKNTLTKVVGNLLKSAQLDGYFTNHSLQRTSATRLFQAGVDTKIVREITGHVSDAINKYQVTSHDQKKEVSDILKGPTTLKFIDNSKECDESYDGDEVKVNPPVLSLELSVSDMTPNSGLKCSCKHKASDLASGDNLSMLINDLVSKHKSSKAKIKLEIEFSD